MEHLFNELYLFNYRYGDWDESSGKPAVLRDGRLSAVYHDEYEQKPVIYEDLKSWERRRAELKEQVLVSAGLWPMPEKYPLNAEIFGRVAFEDFSVEKVMFESYPGFYVTGSLYRPTGKGPFPAILNAHGHWSGGRLHRDDLSDIPLRCANFAKMGFVAFSYDMLGFQDSKQVSHLYGGTVQELWCAGAFGLQLWNSIRSVDFLESLPDVDAGRIGCTGASGGGTQTFFLTAADDRIEASAPVNMVSAYMHGSCNCENAPGLKIGTNNVEIASMAAPRPLLLIASTGDWTRNTPSVEYPAIHSVYELYGKGHEVEYFYQDADHNYNKKAREKAYNWFARKLQGRDVPWTEQDVDFGDIEGYKILKGNDKPSGIKTDMELYELQKKEREHSVKKLWKCEGKTAAGMMLTALSHLTGVSPGQPGDLLVKYSETVEKDGVLIRKRIIGTEEKREEIPVVSICKKGCTDKKILLLFHPEGKNAMFEDRDWRPVLEHALEAGFTVVSGDVFLTGEFHRPWSITGRNPADCNHFTAYNRVDAALRIQDVAAICKYVHREYKCGIILGGPGEAGLWCLAAVPFLHGVQGVMVDFGLLNSLSEEKYLKSFYLPGFLSVGGFETCIRLSGSAQLLLYNVKDETETEFLKAKFGENDSKGLLRIFNDVQSLSGCL